MKLITNIIHLMLLLLVLSMSVSPAHAAILNPEILISEQGNGFYVCNDVDRLASCTKYSGTNVLISEDTTPSFDRNEASLIVFNAPLSFSTRAASAYIQVEYDGINTPECTYAFVAPNNVNIPENNLGVRLVTQSCTLAKDGRSAITAYSTGDQPMFVIELSRLCRVDDSGDGRNCEFDWNDEITSFQLSSAGVAPTDEDLCSNLEDKQTTMPLGYDDADQDYVCTPQRIYIGLSERVYNFYNWALGVGGMVALALIIYAGVLYSASGGNPGRMTEAKLWIQHALFGLALLFGSYIVLSFINPNLTTLEDVFVESAPQVSGGRLEFEDNQALGGLTYLEFPPGFRDTAYVDGYYQMPPSEDGTYYGNPNGNGNNRGTIAELAATGGKDAACGKKELIQVIYSVAKRWKAAHVNTTFRVGDLNGGCINSGVCHDTHDYGVDVDITVSGGATSASYNDAASIELAQMFIDTGAVTGIVFDGNPELIRTVNEYFWDTQGDKLTAWNPHFSGCRTGPCTRNFMRTIGGHDGHFHVHIGDGGGATGTGITPGGNPNVSCTLDTTDNPNARVISGTSNTNFGH